MAEISRTDYLAFTAEWLDTVSSLQKKFMLLYYPYDNTIQLCDLKTRRLFLRRTHCEGLTIQHIYVGNTITVFARQIVILDYADSVTRNKMENAMQRTFALIKPDGLQYKGEIFKTIITNGFKIAKLKMVKLTKEEALEFYSEHKGESFLPFVIDLLTSAPVIVMELMANNGIERLIEIVGPTDPAVAKKEAPNSIRAYIGKNIINNAMHAAKTAQHVDRECNLFFKTRNTSVPKATATFKNCTCCIVKPHAFQDGNLGDIVSMIEENKYVVSGIELIYLDQVNAEEFLEIYNGVIPEYLLMVNQLLSGPCVVMEISGEDCLTPVKFRELVGPTDPEIARQLRPHTIRARFGKNKVENAVHVSDLPEDAVLEVEYFFKLLSC